MAELSCLDQETRAAILTTLKKYAERKLTNDTLLTLDRKDEFPQNILEELYDSSQLGLHLLFIPEAYGGMGGGAQDVYRVAELLAGIDLGVATGVLATFLGSDPIKVGGTPEQKALWMGRIADDALLMAYAATEPQAGSDLASLSTQAVPVIENGQISGYRINGRKQWISNGGVADLYSVLALAPGGPSWFIVERGASGFSHGKPEDKHGIRASNTAALFFDDVFVPADRLVGLQEGLGLSQAQAVFGYTRLMVGAFGLGGGWEALRRAIRYSQTRIQAGSPLSQKQGYTHKLIVPNAIRLEGARSYIEWVAERLDCGEAGLATEGAIAKYIATEAGNRAADDAIQALGGYGYTREYMVEKIKRDVRITTIYEGTSEIMELTIARDRWQAHLKSGGSYYLDWAARLEAVDSSQPDNGAGAAALALRALAALLEFCRLNRLTRSQHILMKLGEWIAAGEAAAIFAQRVLDHPTEAIELDIPTRQAMARVYARRAAHSIASEGITLATGAAQSIGTLPVKTWETLPTTLNLPMIYRTQVGLIPDMDFIAEKLNNAFPVV